MGRRGWNPDVVTIPTQSAYRPTGGMEWKPSFCCFGWVDRVIPPRVFVLTVSRVALSQRLPTFRIASPSPTSPESKLDSMREDALGAMIEDMNGDGVIDEMDIAEADERQAQEEQLPKHGVRRWDPTIAKYTVRTGYAGHMLLYHPMPMWCVWWWWWWGLVLTPFPYALAFWFCLLVLVPPQFLEAETKHKLKDKVFSKRGKRLSPRRSTSTSFRMSPSRNSSRPPSRGAVSRPSPLRAMSRPHTAPASSPDGHGAGVLLGTPCTNSLLQQTSVASVALRDELDSRRPGTAATSPATGRRKGKVRRVLCACVVGCVSHEACNVCWSGGNDLACSPLACVVAWHEALSPHSGCCCAMCCVCTAQYKRPKRTPMVVTLGSDTERHKVSFDKGFLRSRRAAKRAAAARQARLDRTQPTRSSTTHGSVTTPTGTSTGTGTGTGTSTGTGTGTGTGMRTVPPSPILTAAMTPGSPATSMTVVTTPKPGSLASFLNRSQRRGSPHSASPAARASPLGRSRLGTPTTPSVAAAKAKTLGMGSVRTPKKAAPSKEDDALRKLLEGGSSFQLTPPYVGVTTTHRGPVQACVRVVALTL